MNKGFKLMIIEDSLLDIHLAERILEINNYNGELIKAETVAEAISKIENMLDQKKTLPNIILLDMFLVKESGTDLLNYIDSIDESLRGSIKIVVISATKLLFDCEQILKRPNVVRIVDKPFRYEQIVDLL